MTTPHTTAPRPGPGGQDPGTAGRNRALTVVGVAVLVVVVGLVLAFWRPWAGDDDPARADGVAGEQAPVATDGGSAGAGQDVLGPEPFLLSEGTTDATFVEFLDFQCPACASVKPAIDQARAEFGDQVTFAVRFFPLDMHANAVPAAEAAVAADNQGQFEAMYDALFQNQAQWAGLDDPGPTIRGYAEQIGLDLAQYDEDIAAPETRQRVEADKQAAIDLDLASTPSFFLDGRPFQPQSVDDLTAALGDAAGQ